MTDPARETWLGRPGLGSLAWVSHVSYLVARISCLESRVWHLVPRVWYLVSRISHLVSGASCLMSGASRLVSRISYLVSVSCIWDAASPRARPGQAGEYRGGKSDQKSGKIQARHTRDLQ